MNCNYSRTAVFKILRLNGLQNYCYIFSSLFHLCSYYRYVLEPELRFTSEGNLGNGPIANFSEVSHGSLLTQNMHVPENWLVESVVTPYDLDNIRLQDVDSSVYR